MWLMTQDGSMVNLLRAKKVWLRPSLQIGDNVDVLVDDTVVVTVSGEGTYDPPISAQQEAQQFIISLYSLMAQKGLAVVDPQPVEGESFGRPDEPEETFGKMVEE